MSRKRMKALNMDEIFELLEQDDGENHGDVIIVPPDVDGLKTLNMKNRLVRL